MGKRTRGNTYKFVMRINIYKYDHFLPWIPFIYRICIIDKIYYTYS